MFVVMQKGFSEDELQGVVEVHPNPDHALKDGAQSLTFENFQALMA